MYRILEFQTTGTNTIMADHGDQPDRDNAESVAHGVAMYAAISAVEVHTVAIINPEGVVVNKYTYKHTPAPVVEQEGGEE